MLVYSDAVNYNKDQIVSTLKAVPGWEIVDEINYPGHGRRSTSNWYRSASSSRAPRSSTSSVSRRMASRWSRR